MEIDKSHELAKIFYIIYILVVFKKIKESNYIYILHQLDCIGFNLVEISDVEEMIFYLNKTGLRQSYIMSMLLYLKGDIFATMTDIRSNYSELDTFMRTRVDSDRKTDHIIKIKDFIGHKYMVIRSFSRLGPPPSDEMINRQVKPSMTRSFIMDRFNLTLQNEIVRRLFQLRESFDLDVLRYIEVRLITYDDVMKMSVVKLARYYMECIDTIKKGLSNWISMCNAFLDSELSYLRSIKNIKNVKKHTIVFNSDTLTIGTRNNKS